MIKQAAETLTAKWIFDDEVGDGPSPNKQGSQTRQLSTAKAFLAQVNWIIQVRP